MWLGGGIGQSLAFLLARYLVGEWVSALARGKSKKWDVVRCLVGVGEGRSALARRRFKYWDVVRWFLLSRARTRQYQRVGCGALLLCKLLLFGVAALVRGKARKWDVLRYSTALKSYQRRLAHAAFALRMHLAIPALLA